MAIDPLTLALVEKIPVIGPPIQRGREKITGGLMSLMGKMPMGEEATTLLPDPVYDYLTGSFNEKMKYLNQYTTGMPQINEARDLVNQGYMTGQYNKREYDKLNALLNLREQRLAKNEEPTVDAPATNTRLTDLMAEEGLGDDYHELLRSQVLANTQSGRKLSDRDLSNFLKFITEAKEP